MGPRRRSIASSIIEEMRVSIALPSGLVSWGVAILRDAVFEAEMSD